MYISKIMVKNFRNFHNLDIEFQEGLNVIVGPNNVGKTNFMRIIGFLNADPNFKATIDDFNKYVLYNNIEIAKTTPPTIEIEYTIEHDLNFDDEDSAFSKLSNILVFNSETGNLDENQDGTIKLIGKVSLRYEYDIKEIDEYRKELSTIQNFNELYQALNKLQENFKWNFYNTTTQEVIDKKIMNNIFDIDRIDAPRIIDKLTDNSKKYVNEKIKEKNIDIFSIKQGITNNLQHELNDVRAEINKDINEDQNQIGITNGRNKFVSNFVFDGDIADFFKYELEDDSIGFPLPLNFNGLGYNNLIYIRNLLKQKRNNDYNIILLEEPEAHLHPNMQYKLLNYIDELKEQSLENSKIKNQIFVTTHSSNITANLNTKNIILLTIDRSENNIIPVSRATNLSNNYNFEKVKCLFENPEYDVSNRTKLLQDGEKHLARFLDVTRSDLLFSDKIILVEGIAEKLLLPKMFPNLVKEHVSIIELGGINFNYFLPVVFNTNKKVLCITDKDIDIIEKQDKELILNISKYQDEKPSIDLLFNGFKNQIKVTKQEKFGSTFEKELFIENYDNLFEELMRLVLPDNYNDLIKHKDIKYWNSHYGEEISNGKQKKFIKEMIDDYFRLFEKEIHNEFKVLIEKMFFTNLFYHYVENKKGKFALDLFEYKDMLIVPAYIKEGVEWLML